MSAVFKREQRYIVIKLSDLADMPKPDTAERLGYICEAISINRERKGELPLECVVIESDWKCYEQAWALVEREHSGEIVSLPPLPQTSGYEPDCPYPQWVNDLLLEYGQKCLAQFNEAAEEIETLQAPKQSPAVAAIQFAIETDDGIDFLRLWNEGEFDEIRKYWADAPKEIYIGADSLLKPIEPKEIAWQPAQVDPEQIRQALQQVQFTTHENGIDKVPRELISAARYAIEKLQRELATVNSAMQKIDGMIAVDDKTVLDAMLLIDTIVYPPHADRDTARTTLNKLSTYRAIGPINNRG